MRKFYFLLLSLSLLHQISFGQSKSRFSNRQKYSADTVKHTLDELFEELSLKHPGFYRYTSRETFMEFADSLKATITDSLSIRETMIKFKAMISKINCNHSSVTYGADYAKHLNEQANLLPLQLYFTKGRAFVVQNLSRNKELLPGDEVITVNERTPALMISLLYPLIPSDGYNLTLKSQVLYYQFPLWYRYIDTAQQYVIRYRRNGVDSTLTISPEKYTSILRPGFLQEQLPQKILRFESKDSIAILTIHSFAQSDIRKAGQQFKKFIDKSFETIRNQDIKHLVIDLRDNTGGSDPFAVYLSKQFFADSFRYWKRIEVTEAVAKEIKGVALKLFYRKPIKIDSIWHWQKARKHHDFDFYEPQAGVGKPWTGKTYLLTNGFSQSSCADFVAVLSSNHKALVAGTESGGGYYGNNSGIMPSSIVKPFGFVLTVPLQKYVNAVSNENPSGRGTQPDYPIELSIDDILASGDREMEILLTWIKSGKKPC